MRRLAFAVVLGLTADAHASDEPLKLCTDDFLNDRSRAAPLYVDVTAEKIYKTDLATHDDWIGDRAATDGIHSWRPLATRKTTICGELAAFGTFFGGGDLELVHFVLGDALPEVDWNLFLVPGANTPSAQRFALVKEFMTAGGDIGELESCRDTADCFEAEITAPRELRNLHSGPGWVSPEAAVGHPFCAYGPWVGDSGHGYKPEVHPAERIWWSGADSKTAYAEPKTAYLALLQDASQRFVERDAYIRASSPFLRPAEVRSLPWASPDALSQARFRIFFYQQPNGLPLTIDLEYFGHSAYSVEVPKQKVESGQTLPLPDRYKIKVQARPSLLSREVNPKSPGMSWDACEVHEGDRRAKPGVYGVLVLHQRVGCGGCGDDGFQAIKVTTGTVDEVVRLRDVSPFVIGGRRLGTPIVLTSRLNIDESGRAGVADAEAKAPELRWSLISIDPDLDEKVRPTDALRALLRGRDRMTRLTRFDIEASPSYVGAGARPEVLDEKTKSFASLVSMLCQREPSPQELDQLPSADRPSFAVCHAAPTSKLREADPFLFEWRLGADEGGRSYVLDATECARDRNSPLCRVPICKSRFDGALEPATGCPDPHANPHALLAIDESRHKRILLPSDRENTSYRREYEDHVYLLYFKQGLRYTQDSGLPCYEPEAWAAPWQSDWMCAGPSEERSRTLASHFLRVDTRRPNALCGWLDGFLVGDHLCFATATKPLEGVDGLLSSREQQDLVLQGLVQFRFFASGQLSFENIHAVLRSWWQARMGQLPAVSTGLRRKPAPSVK